MSTFSLGSIVTEVHKLIPGVPSTISGTNMESAVFQQLLVIQSYTGDTIGSNSIAEKYQPAMTFLTAAAVLGNMELQGIDGTSVSLGELSVTKGGQSNTTNARKSYYDMGMQQLRLLGREVRFTKANG